MRCENFEAEPAETLLTDTDIYPVSVDTSAIGAGSVSSLSVSVNHCFFLLADNSKNCGWLFMKFGEYVYSMGQLGSEVIMILEVILNIFQISYIS